MECDIIKDLLPLYVEQLTSEASKMAVEKHLEECENCKKVYREMKTPEPHIQYDREPAESFRRYVKKSKRKYGLKVAISTAAVVLLVVVVHLIVLAGLIGLLAFDSARAEVQQDTDVSHYQWYMGENAKKEYAHKMGVDESIFPQEITTEMNVKEYKMVYYNPWDPEYLSYLTVEYEEDAYRTEVERLKQYPSTEYLRYYCVEGFAEEYELLAIEASSYGFVYALNLEENQIIYVEILFCNYFTDIDYKTMISQEYLPIGFDATVENPYRKEKMGR